MEYRIQMMKKLNSFIILITAVLIRNPFASFSSVVKVKHRRNGIHSDTICMIDLCPEKRIGYKEVTYLWSCIVKDKSSPMRMHALTRILIFIKTGAIKGSKSESILREMCWNPVKNNAYSLLVHVVHEISKILRCSISTCWSIITSYLVAP